MYLSIKCRDFYNFGANHLHAELLKSVRFVFYLIIMVIPWTLCFPSYLTISHCFLWCFRVFPPSVSTIFFGVSTVFPQRFLRLIF